MAVRATQLREPGLRIKHGDVSAFLSVFSFDRGELFVRGATPACAIGDVCELEWTGPGRLLIEARIERCTPIAPDGLRGLTLSMRRVTSRASEASARHFVQAQLGIADPTLTSGREGGTWWIALRPEAAPPLEPAPRAFKGPPPRVAGQQATAALPPPLETGRPATTVAILRDYFQSGPHRVGMYLNVPCAYTVAGAQYWGRALRLNDRFVQINTATVVPGLGVRIRVDLTAEIDGVRRPASVFGIMSQKKDPPGGSTYKATLQVRVGDIDEGDSPGLLIALLERKAAEKAERAEDDSGPVAS